jgi:cytochrome c oxidase subunit 4
MTERTEHALNAGEEAHHPMAHVMSMPMLLGVYAALIVLTVITVLAATPQFDFGGWNLWIAMIIATAKAGLVALYFMHLRYDNPFNGIVFVTALLFLGIFLSITLVDVIGYQPEIQSFQEAQPGP